MVFFTRMKTVSLWCAAAVLLLRVGAAEEPRPANSILVRSYEYNRGNVLVQNVGTGYADREAVVINGGQAPNTMEYDLDFPVSGPYALFARYTAMDSRPVDIFLDEALVVRGFKSVTGSWQSSAAIWEKQADLQITAGRHTVKLICPGPCIPHIVAIRLDSAHPFPPGWKRRPRPIEANLNRVWSGKPEPGKFDYEAYVRADGFVDAPVDYDPILPYNPVPPPAPRAERLLEYLLMGEGRYRVEATVRQDEWGEQWEAALTVKVTDQRTDTGVLPLSPERVEKMLTHARELVGRFRAMAGEAVLTEEEARSGRMLQELERLRALGDGDRSKWEGLYDLYVRAYLLKNRVALSNPLLDFAKLLFVKRLTYDTSHIYTTYFDGSHRFGGGLHTLSPVRPDGAATSLVRELSDQAIYRDPDLSWEGTRALFAYKPDPPTPYRLYEVGLDGTGLRQLTSSDYDDIDPCYLSNGRIMFVSTRCRRVVLCHNAFTVSVLHTMAADGSDVRCASTNTVNDFTPSVLADGRVAFTRWEYVDKHLGNNQSMWIVNPDGSSPVHMSGEHWGPITLWEPRQVPGSPKIVCTLAPHMPIAVGPIALVDPADVCSSPARFENLTPEIPPPHHFGWSRTDSGYYCNPFPLSEDYYLVSYAYGPDDREPAGYGLYLLDRWNNRDLVYRDPATSCFEAFPVKPRRRPPVLPETATANAATGRYCIVDIHQGLDGIERGAVKSLRVIEEIPKPVSAQCGAGFFGLQYPVISNGGHLVVKRLLGEVPVEPDGSVFFEAPANRGLYFTALDGNGMELQRMRALTQIAPGETVSCIGCHEHRTTAPPNHLPLALGHAASAIIPPPEGAHALDFARDVQPVLTRHCVKCHSGASPAGKLDLSPDPTNLFNVAYENLTFRGYVNYVHANNSDTLPLRPPKYYGSHASKIIQVLQTTHRERVQLARDDFRRLVTWIDLNAPYYGTYLYSRPGTSGGRELLTPGIRASLDAIYQKRCASCHGKEPMKIQAITFLNVQQSPALLAPLAKAAGGSERCGKPIFADRSDPDAKALSDTLDRLAEEIRTNPREDMLAERPAITDANCRYVYRP